MRKHWDFFKESDTSMGVFYPLHYVVAAFESEERARIVEIRFLDAGFAREDVAVADGRFVVDLLETTEGSNLIEKAQQTVVRAVGTEFGYLDDDRKIAEKGGAFVFAYAPDDETTARATDVLTFAHPIYARRYNAVGIHRIHYPRQSVL
ncbi:hypothetical protein ACQQ2N_17690 [Dokdonella sp. MW10]|uniref:hypothetical protein n=1 Tax=Dokdonella sp. MW10 TaxID=2992926 RepID=UPI003F813FEE